MIRYAGLVDIGVHEPHNDDRALLGTHVLTDGTYSGETEEPYFLAAVCDGVSGMQQGGRAAELTASALAACCRAGLDRAALCEQIEAANTELRTLQQQEQLSHGLRTTLAGLYIDGDRLTVFNAGDSRVYRQRYQFLRQLSKDHSLVQDLIDLGQITPEEARRHPQKNIISKCIGHEDSVRPRIKELSDDLMPGDLFMLCSDGITDVLTEEQLRALLHSHIEDADLGAACKALYDAAVANGAMDNISVLLIRKESADTYGGTDPDHAAGNA